MSLSNPAESKAESISLYKKINYIFDRKQKNSLVGLGFMILLGGIFETLGVSMMVPVVTVILDPESLHRAMDKVPALERLAYSLGLDSDKKQLCAILALLIIIYIVKNVVLTLVSGLFIK